MTRKPRKPPTRANSSRGKQPETSNRRLAEQTRKILRTHYASKYRVR
jgi:hypothetical protein